jgi:hypothetical protein
MLPKVHTRGQRQEWQVGQIRGAVHEAVCRSIFGRELCGYEGIGEIEAIEYEEVDDF